MEKRARNFPIEVGSLHGESARGSDFPAFPAQAATRPRSKAKWWAATARAMRLLWRWPAYQAGLTRVRVIFARVASLVQPLLESQLKVHTLRDGPVAATRDSAAASDAVPLRRVILSRFRPL